MFHDTHEINGYTIIINTTKVIPRMVAGDYEAKVTFIYDQNEKTEIPRTDENTFMRWGKGEEVAYNKCLAEVTKWAESRR